MGSYRVSLMGTRGHVRDGFQRVAVRSCVAVIAWLAEYIRGWRETRQGCQQFTLPSFPRPRNDSTYMVYHWPGVPCINIMGISGPPHAGVDVGHDLDTGGCEGDLIEIEGPLYMCIRGQVGVEEGGLQEVEGDDRLGQKSAPELYLEVEIVSA